MSDDSDIEIVFVGEESPVSPVYGRQSGRLENYEQVTAIEIEAEFNSYDQEAYFEDDPTLENVGKNVNDHTMSGKDTCSDTQESVQQVAADSTVESSDQNMMETSDSEDSPQIELGQELVSQSDKRVVPKLIIPRWKLNKYKIFECIYCKKKISRRDHYNLHVKRRHPDAARCNFCLVYFLTVEDLDNHVSTKHAHEQFLMAQQQSKDNETVQQVAEDSAVKAPEPEMCLICRMYMPKEELNSHVENNHPGATKCTVCLTDLHTQTALNDHIMLGQCLQPDLMEPSLAQDAESTLKRASEKNFDSVLAAVVKRELATDPAAQATAREHNKKYVLGNTMHECKFCGLMICRQNNVSQHIKRCHPEALRCSFCCEYFNSQLELHGHVIQQHSEKTGVPRKQKEGGSESSRRSQKDLNATRKPKTGCYKCFYCNGSFLWQPSLATHIKKFHPSAIGCHYCFVFFQTEEELNVHNTFGCRAQTWMRANLLPKAASSSKVGELQSGIHSQETAEDGPTQSPLSLSGENAEQERSKKFCWQLQVSECAYCAKVFKKIANLKRHIKRSHPNEVLQCDECKVNIYTPYDKIVHKNQKITNKCPHCCGDCSSMPGNSLYCKFCQQTFACSGLAGIHMETCSADQINSCPFCGLAIHATIMNRHLAPQTCLSCGTVCPCENTLDFHTCNPPGRQFFEPSVQPFAFPVSYGHLNQQRAEEGNFQYDAVCPQPFVSLEEDEPRGETGDSVIIPI